MLKRNVLARKLTILLPAHWYQLPPSDYYQHAACTELKEDARFYDPNDTANSHGDAVCTIDCLMPNKNAILPLLTFPDLFKRFIYCIQAPSSELSCAKMLTERVTYAPIADFCSFVNFTNIQAGNWIVRLRIYDITWGSPSIGNDLSDSTDLYMPNSINGIYGGSMYEEDDRALKWRNHYAPEGGGDAINVVITGCSIARNLPTQQDIINQCRLNYTSIFGNLVGYHTLIPTDPIIPVIPSTRDLMPSMDVNCQYVYDIADHVGCPLIDDMCKSSGMRGEWRYSLAPDLTSADNRMNLLPQHLCQNILYRQQPYGAPWDQPPDDPHPNNQYLAGMGRQGDPGYLIGSTEPQSSSAYIYRSCALQDFTATPEFCCANDFADGEGGTIFNPLTTQAPIVPNVLPGVHRSPLIGYPYDSKGTPWYGNCFDRNGLTCPILARDITGTGCGPFMSSHCAVSPETSAPESWNVSATDGSCECSRWLGRLLYGAGGRWIQFLTIVANREQLPDNTGTLLSPDIISDIVTNLHKVFTMKTIFDNGMSPLALAMEPVVFALYNSYNFTLYDGAILLNQCAVYTIDDAVKNPLLRKWCGCMLNPVSYESRYPIVSIACTPTCNSSEVLQYGAPCEGTLCVLDDITISLIDSKSGGVSLVQVCQSCGQVYSSDTTTVKQTCQCTIGNVAVSLINSTIGTITVDEICGKDGNGGKPAPTTSTTGFAKVLKASRVTVETFPYAATTALVIIGILAIVAFLASRVGGTASRNWAKGLRIGCIILAVIILAFMIYSIVVRSI